ncbi:MAG TPA: IclR family transcriptional regulator [Usitatibacteraceae bacterium]|nr:IclR family transcriptional regulator [Usitatibacteraceae bacterium]
MADYGIGSVDRALDVLAAFKDCDDPLGLADLARLTGVNKTTVLRICSSLERRGFLLRDHRSRYRLGPAMYELGKQYESGIHLGDVVIPMLVELADAVRESASFHVRSGNARLCMYRVNAHHAVVDNVKTGDHLPLERGAPGRVLLAYGPLPPAGSEEIGRNGYALSFGDRDPHCAAVSVPVFKIDNELCGALSVSGPRERFTQAYARKILPAVVAAAERMSARLGATPVRALPVVRAGAKPLVARGGVLAPKGSAPVRGARNVRP